MSSFEDEMKEALEEFRKVCINKTPGPGFQLTAAAITAAHERDMEQFVERLKRRLFGLLSRPEDGGLYLDDAWDAIDAEQRARIKGEEDNK